MDSWRVGGGSLDVVSGEFPRIDPRVSATDHRKQISRLPIRLSLPLRMIYLELNDVY